jgi:hypothetical protein
MNVNPIKWFGTRQLKSVPPHFIRASTPLTSKAKVWVVSKLSGRFATIDIADDSGFFIRDNEAIFFEDPAELMMYELRWSGSK